MRKFAAIAATLLIACAAILASDWPSQGGNPQRDGWAKYENAFTKTNVGGLQLLYTFRADNPAKGLTAPLVDGLLITYRGFKEMLVFGGSSNYVYSVDADLNKLIWQVPLLPHPEPPARGPCSVALTASLAMPGSSTSSGRGSFRQVRPPGGVTPVARTAPAKPSVLATGFGRIGAFLAVSGDGKLHVLNTSTGEDQIPAFAFVPEGVSISSLNVSDDTVYAATSRACPGAPTGVYAADLSSDTPKVSSFLTNGSAIAGSLGTAIGRNGTVYAQVHATGAVVALASRTLEPLDNFAPASAKATATDATPVIFEWNRRELLVAAAGDGSLYLLDAVSLGGSDHQTPLFKTAPAGSGFHGGFSSWEDTATGTRWVYAFEKNRVAAFKVEDQNGHPALVPAWTSLDMIAPAPAVIANGIVFVLSTGDDDKKKANAVLYALDASTGEQLFSSESAVKSFSNNGGLAIANRRIYFTTHDNTVYCYGFFADEPQLTGQ
jgi:outer membrane protein assembly factor BamB